MDDLIAFLRARLDEDEQWALAASRPYPYADGAPGVPESGVRWQWVEGPDWEPTRPDPAVREFVAEPGVSCNLVSVETWPSSGRLMPRPVATEIIEMDSAAAGHIVRHDPARVLREVAAKRGELADHTLHDDGESCRRCVVWGVQLSLDPGPAPAVAARVPFPCPTLRRLALPYADHKDYQEGWKP